MSEPLDNQDAPQPKPHLSGKKRRVRAYNRRQMNENEKVVIGLIVAAGVIGSYLFARTINIQTGRSLAGAAILCFAIPTIAFFVIYGPFWRFVAWVRGKRK